MEKHLLQTITEKLQKAYSPLNIYLFGSHAWGVPTAQSDVDLVVVVDESDEKPYRRATKGIRALRGLGIAKDILVYTKEEFSKLSEETDTLLYKVKHEGTRLL